MPSNPVKADGSTLIVDNLRVAFGGSANPVRALDGVSLTVGRERVAIVGESGSGKSTIGRAVMRLLPHTARISADRICLGDTDLLRLAERDMRALRGRRISMILQDPRYSLHPTVTVGHQILEAYRLLRPTASKAEGRQAVLDMLHEVRIDDPERVYGLYRHQVSGGMGQRIVIAMMLIQEPELLIADEPTSALDVVVRQRVLEILDEQVRRRGLGLLFISHDLNLVRSFCDRVVVMYRGRIVEEIDAANIENATHPYTQGLLNALPSAERRGAPLPVIVPQSEWSAV